jgi:hypothetical protein
MGGSVDGWIGGWVDGWMGGWVDGWMGGFAAKDRLLERLNNFLQDQDDHSSASLTTPSSPRQQPPEQQQLQQALPPPPSCRVVGRAVSCFMVPPFSAAVCLSDSFSHLAVPRPRRNPPPPRRQPW